MHRQVTRGTRCETIGEFASAITDNFCVIDPDGFSDRRVTRVKL